MKRLVNQVILSEATKDEIKIRELPSELKEVDGAEKRIKNVIYYNTSGIMGLEPFKTPSLQGDKEYANNVYNAAEKKYKGARKSDPLQFLALMIGCLDYGAQKKSTASAALDVKRQRVINNYLKGIKPAEEKADPKYAKENLNKSNDIMKKAEAEIIKAVNSEDPIEAGGNLNLDDARKMLDHDKVLLAMRIERQLKKDKDKLDVAMAILSTLSIPKEVDRNDPRYIASKETFDKTDIAKVLENLPTQKSYFQDTQMAGATEEINESNIREIIRQELIKAGY